MEGRMRKSTVCMLVILVLATLVIGCISSCGNSSGITQEKVGKDTNQKQNAAEEDILQPPALPND
jgi:hypothetical protein